MAPIRETALQRWGRELSYAREAAGMTGKDLAEAVYIGRSTLGMWETGQRMPKHEDIERCEKRLGTNGYLGRLLTQWVSQEVSPEWLEWIRVEEQAGTLLWFELSVIPGLLQTEDYARAVLRYNRHAPIDVDERVRARLERQAILTQGDPPTCVFVIDEYALRRSVGEREVMYAQLMRIRELAEHPDIIVQVVPSGTGYYAGCPFVIAKVDGKEVAYQDGALTGSIIENPDQVCEITKIWQHIHSSALPDKASIELLESAAQSWKA